MSTSPPNEGRLLAIGDIHGCLDHLVDLVSIIDPTENDRIVFLGDYVDRGPQSRGVIDFLLAFYEEFPETIFLKGNHEAMFLDLLAGRDPTPFLLNGGMSTLKSYDRGEGFVLPSAHRDFLGKLPVFYETERFIFVHAGLRPPSPLEKQAEEDLLWIRGDFLDSAFDWGKTVVFGHTPRSDPLLEEKRIGIDTGAVFGGCLTCCDVERRECIFSTGGRG